MVLFKIEDFPVMRFRVLSLRRPSLRRGCQLHHMHGLGAKHYRHPVLQRNQAADQARIGIGRDARVNDRAVYGNVFRGKKPDHARSAHGNAVHGFNVPDAFPAQHIRRIFHVLLQRHELASRLIMPVRNDQVHMIIPGHGFR